MLVSYEFLIKSKSGAATIFIFQITHETKIIIIQY